MKKPPVKKIQLLGNEERILTEQMAELQRAQENFNRSATMILAREGITYGIFRGIENGKLIVAGPSV